MNSLPIPDISRRQLLSRVGNGFGMLGLAGLLQDSPSLLAAPQATPISGPAPHFAPKAKRVIVLFMSGGPSQVDTFDPKPLLEKYAGQRPESANIRTSSKTTGLMPSTVKFIPSGKSGIPVADTMPRIASHIDDMAVIRSMHTDFTNHAPALCMMNLGTLTPTRPSVGSWTTYGLGSENQNLPGFVVLCPGKPVVGPKLWGSAFLPGRFQATHINNKQPKPESMLPNLRNEVLSQHDQQAQVDLINQLNRQHLSQHPGDDALETRIRSLELAYRMQVEALETFDVMKEPQKIREEYGSSNFSNACLMARRLSEKGVRFVQVYYGNRQPWDTHSKHSAGNKRLCTDIDRPVAALLNDLKRRGLFEETLVVWTGEFGRTPTTQNGDGRDHNPFGFSMWMAGGGIKGGTVHGATDEFGFRSIENKVHVHDLHATMLHLLGLDHERLTYHYSGRDFRLTDVAGRVVNEVIA